MLKIFPKSRDQSTNDKTKNRKRYCNSVVLCCKIMDKPPSHRRDRSESFRGKVLRLIQKLLPLRTNEIVRVVKSSAVMNAGIICTT